ncbi:MAG TPA: UPF0149 family protein [Wenzhouxiangella sp.]
MSKPSTDQLRWALALASSPDATGVSESHGLITGLIAGQPNLDVDRLWVHWAGLNLDVEHDIDDPADPQATHREHLEAALEDTQKHLQSAEMTFEALVPSMDQPLAQRTEGLAHWCGGFLAGFGASGAVVRDEQATEVLALLSEIARASSEADESNDSSTDDLEAEEEAFVELVEFVKVAVLLLHEERRLNEVRAKKDPESTGDEPTA